MNDRERADRWLNSPLRPGGFSRQSGSIVHLAAEFAAVRADERGRLLPALRLAVEAMEKCAKVEAAWERVDDDEYNDIWEAWDTARKAALAACRKEIGDE